MRKHLIIAVALLVLFSTYKPQKINLTTIFNTKKIIIENNFVLKEEEILNQLNFIYDKNLIFLNTSDIKKILIKNSFIKSFEIKKIYPNKLKIKIFEKKPIVILQDKKNKFYFIKNKNLIDYKDLEIYKKLPVVFSNKENFEILYIELEKVSFSLDQIKKFYYFETKRWDLLTHNNQTIKLPIEDYISSLKNFLSIRKKKNFDKYKIFDYRINDQLILK